MMGSGMLNSQASCPLPSFAFAWNAYHADTCICSPLARPFECTALEGWQMPLTWHKGKELVKDMARWLSGGMQGDIL